MKKVLAILVSTVLLLSILCISAPAAPAAFDVSLGTVSASAGSTVDVPITVNNNTGIWGFQFTVSYDANALNLDGITVDQAWSNMGIMDIASGANPGSVQGMASSFNNSTATGSMGILHFTVKQGATAGDYALETAWRPNDCIDADSNEVQTNVTPGKITVKKSVSANPDFDVQIGTVSGKAGDIVDVPVNVVKNTGIWGFQFTLSYDANALEVQSFTVDQAWQSMGIMDIAVGANPAAIQGMASSFNNNTATGSMGILKFKIKDGAANGDYPITADWRPNDCIDADSNEVETRVQDGKVTVGAANVTTTTTQGGQQHDPNANFKVEVGTVSGKAGDTVEVPLNVVKNAGIWGFQFTLAYDSNALEVQGLAVDSAWASMGLMDVPAGANPIAIQAMASGFTDNTSTGLMGILTFKIKDGAANGDYPITATWRPNDCINANGDEVSTDVADGKVTVGDTNVTTTTSNDDNPTTTTTQQVIDADFDIQIGTVNGKAGDTVEVPVTVLKNVGIWGFQFAINYDDSKLELQGFNTDSAWSSMGIMEVPAGANPAIIQGMSSSMTSDFTGTGLMGNLVFKIKDGVADGEEIAVTGTADQKSCINLDGAEVTTGVRAGKVTVGDDVISTPDTTTTTQPVVDADFLIEIGKIDSCKPGDQIKVPVTVTKNKGIWGFQVEVKYDSAALTLDSFEVDPAWSSMGIMEVPAGANPAVIQGMSASMTNDFTATGLMGYLVFTVNAGTADGDYAITADVIQNSCINLNGDEVETAVVAGNVHVGEAAATTTTTKEPDLEPVSEEESEESEVESNAATPTTKDKGNGGNGGVIVPTQADEPAEDTPNTGSALPIAAIVLAISSAAVLTISRKK